MTQTIAFAQWNLESLVEVPSPGSALTQGLPTLAASLPHSSSLQRLQRPAYWVVLMLVEVKPIQPLRTGIRHPRRGYRMTGLSSP